MALLEDHQVVNPRGDRGIYHLSTGRDGLALTSVCLSKAVMVPAVITVPEFRERGFSDPLICDRCLAAVLYRPREDELIRRVNMRKR